MTSTKPDVEERVDGKTLTRQRDEAMAQRDALARALRAAYDALEGIRQDLEPVPAMHSAFYRAWSGAKEAAKALKGAL